MALRQFMQVFKGTLLRHCEVVFIHDITRDITNREKVLYLR